MKERRVDLSAGSHALIRPVNGEAKRLYFKVLIKGLYLVGASTFPGGGVEGVVISGLICARDIMS